MHSQEGHAENVIGILEGSDPVLKDEFVVMSAHLDHIGLSAPLPDGHNVNNGADDDGSGSTGLLGVAHAYAEGAAKGIRPKRSIIFLWNGGEETRPVGFAVFHRVPAYRPQQSGGRPEHGHDRPHQEPQFGGPQSDARAGGSGRGFADRPEHLERATWRTPSRPSTRVTRS